MFPVARDPPAWRDEQQQQQRQQQHPPHPASSASHPAPAAAAASASPSSLLSPLSSPRPAVTRGDGSLPSDLSPTSLMRPDRDMKNLLQFRIPHEVSTSASSAGSGGGSGSASKQQHPRNTSPFHTNLQHNPAHPHAASSAAAHGRNAAAASAAVPASSTWAAAIAASVHANPHTKTKAKHTHSEANDTNQTHTPLAHASPAAKPHSSITAAAPAGSGASAAPVSAPFPASTASPLPNAWHRSDKPSWGAAAAAAQPSVPAHKKKATPATLGAVAAMPSHDASAHSKDTHHSAAVPDAAASAGAAVGGRRSSITGSLPTSRSASSKSKGGSSSSNSSASTASGSTHGAASHASSTAGGSSSSSGSKRGSFTSTHAHPAAAAAAATSATSGSIKKAAAARAVHPQPLAALSNDERIMHVATSQQQDSGGTHAVAATTSVAGAVSPAATAAPPSHSPSLLPTVLESTISRTNFGDPHLQAVSSSAFRSLAQVAEASPPASASVADTPLGVDGSLPLAVAPPDSDSDQVTPLPGSAADLSSLSQVRRPLPPPLTGSSGVSARKVESSSDLTRRLWSHLLDNLNRTTNELFYLCNRHMSSTQAARCRQVLHHLNTAQTDFTRLMAHAEKKSASKVSSGTSSSAASTSSSSKETPSSSTKPLSRSRKAATPITSGGSSSSTAAGASGSSASRSSSKVQPTSPSHVRSSSRPIVTAAAATAEAEDTVATSSSSSSSGAIRRSSKSSLATSSSGSKKKASSTVIDIGADTATTTPTNMTPDSSAPVPQSHAHHGSIGEEGLFGFLTGRQLLKSPMVTPMSHTLQHSPLQPPRTPPHSRAARAAAAHSTQQQQQPFSRIPTLSGSRGSVPPEQTTPGSASKWNAASALLESGQTTFNTEDNEASTTPAAAGVPDSTTMSESAPADPTSASINDADSSHPPMRKSAWISQSQTQSLLSLHKGDDTSAVPASVPVASVAAPLPVPATKLSTRSPAFKPMQLVLTNDNTAPPVVTPITAGVSASSPVEPHTPPPTLMQQQRAAQLADPLLPRSLSNSGSARDSSELSPLQMRLNSPDRLQARLRLPFAQMAASSSAADASPTSAPAVASLDAALLAAGNSSTTPDVPVSTSPDIDAAVAEALKSTYDAKQEKAARNRELQLQSQKRKLLELNSIRIADVEQRRESRLKSKGASTETRLQAAAEVHDTHLESRRRRAENENQKVRELAFINAASEEERKYSIAQKQCDSEARVRMLQEKRLESIRGINSAKSSITDERKREAQAAESKQKVKHDRIDQRLELAEARRLQSKSKSRSTHSISTSLGGSSIGTPSESPFHSPRPGTAGSTSSHVSGPGDASASAAASPRTSLGGGHRGHSSMEVPHDLNSSLREGGLHLSSSPSEPECSFCSLCKVKLYTDEYVRRHVSGKKHQALLAEQLVKGGPTEPLAETAEGGDGYIVRYSSLLSAASRRPQDHPAATVHAFLADPALQPPSKSSRRNQKKKARQLRQRLAQAGSGAESESDEGAAQPMPAESSSSSSAAAAPAVASSSKRKDSSHHASSHGDATIEEVQAMPPTRLRTQALSLLALIERADKVSGGAQPATTQKGDEAPANHAPSKQQLLLVTESFESELKEELQNILVRLDEELLVLKNDAHLPVSAVGAASEEESDIPTLAVASPPALKQLLASKLIQYILSPTLSASAGAGTFSSESVRLAAEVIYSCCRSSPIVVDALLKHRLIPLVDLASRSLYQMHFTHAQQLNAASAGHMSHMAVAPSHVMGAGGATVVSVHAPVAPPPYLEYIFLTLAVVLKEPDEVPSPTHTSRSSSDAASTYLHQRRTHSTRRQEFVRYICLSELLARVVHYFTCIDRYMTLVPAASISATSLAMLSAPPSALSTPTHASSSAASKTLPPPVKTAVARGGATKDRLSAKLAAQRSLKSTPSKSSSALSVATTLPLSHLPIHTPVVPHASYVAAVVSFLDALTTMPPDAATLDGIDGNVSGVLAAQQPPLNKRKPTHSLFNYALQRALKDTVCTGLLSLIGSVTLSHWIIPAAKSITAHTSQIHEGHAAAAVSASASASASASTLTSRDKALATVLSSESTGLLISSFRVLNNIARVDLPLLHEFSESFQPHLFGILAFLLPYCQLHLPKPSITSSTVHNQLIELVLPFMGYIALLAPGNQKMMTQWRDQAAAADEAHVHASEGDAAQSPTLLQHLCHLPAQFYTDPRLQALLFPTLLACVYDPNCTPSTSANKQVLMAELSPSSMAQLQAWMDAACGNSNTTEQSEQAGAVTSNVATDAVAATPSSACVSSPPPPSAALPRPSSRSSLRPSPPLSPADVKSSVVLKKRSSSGACASSPPDFGEAAASVSAAAAAANAPVVNVPSKVKSKKPAVPLQKTSTKGKETASAATSASTPVSSSARRMSSAAEVDADGATAVGDSAAVTSTASSPVPAGTSTAAGSGQLVLSTPPLQPHPARADLARRFPPELIKRARAQLFD